MTRKKKILIGLVIVVVLGAHRLRQSGIHAHAGVDGDRGEDRAARSRSDRLGQRQDPAEAARSTSAPRRSGKVVNLDVHEGDIVKKGQLLLQIDPRNLETQVDSREASLATARSQLEQTEAQVENAQARARAGRRTRSSVRKA